MMIKPPHAIGCKCEVSMPFTVAMAPRPQTPLQGRPGIWLQRCPAVGYNQFGHIGAAK